MRKSTPPYSSLSGSDKTTGNGPNWRKAALHLKFWHGLERLVGSRMLKLKSRRQISTISIAADGRGRV